ncbi:MAG: hypothetical protein IAI49_09510 [Candidatus Eremiobacteraeota bacterium]|nr:hypothetical protein [Candidatus Eremiobacteraeota bacterium]
MEYEFHNELAPFETRNNLIGTSYAIEESALIRKLELKYRHALPRVPSAEEAPLGRNSSCWARLVEYTDGSHWIVSPL